MNEALEDEDLKDMYILSDLLSDRFKDMRWEVNHGVSGCRVTYIVFKAHVYREDGIVWNLIQLENNSSHLKQNVNQLRLSWN